VHWLESRGFPSRYDAVRLLWARQLSPGSTLSFGQDQLLS
jgi:hypothetical protein